MQLTVALRALCQNALDALGHRGRIEITVTAMAMKRRSRSPTMGRVSRPSSGRISSSPYSARQAGRGVGMGLSKCWRIVTQHGGRIEVGSRAGSGAVFTIRLPVQTRCKLAPLGNG